jgi:hypothetical protein
MDWWDNRVIAYVFVVTSMIEVLRAIGILTP